uniref:glycosyltransferase family 4 protein n=1 Tax=Paenibacillus sp. FSL R10-2734 TaxID=2954691 RepID=UPI00403FBE89
MSFHLPYMELLQQKGCEVHAYAQPGEARLRLEEKGIVCHDVPIQRSPLQMRNWAALGILTESFKKEGFQFVHVHTPVASILGRIAAHRAGVPCTLYTAHGFHFFKGAPLLNWMLYYPLERLMARWTDVLITINSEDHERAQKFSVRKKVTYVSGVGLDLQVYGSEQEHCEAAKEKAERRRQLFNLRKSDNDELPFVVLCVAELNANKNQKQLIEALGQLGVLAGNIHLAFAGTGPFDHTLTELANRLGVNDQVHLLGYRKDIPDLLRACDVAALVSYREGLPRAIMEAMAVGKPVIGTHIRGIRDLIEHESTGMLVPVDDITVTAKALIQLRDDPALTKAMGEANKERIIRYGLPAVLRAMDSIYVEALNKGETLRLPSEMHASLSGD